MSRTFSSVYKNNYSSDYVDILKMKCTKTCAINNYPIDNDSIYLKITDAALTYLTINDANANYLKIVDASLNYLKIVDASTDYLSRIGVATSIATSTSFNGTLTTGTINGVVLYTNASYGTKIGTTITMGSLSANCVLFGDNILLGNSPSYTNQNVLVGSNIGTGGDYGQNVAVGTAIMKTSQNQTNNVCVGYFSCNGGGGSDTTAVGASSARNSSGGQNVAVGSNSLLANTTGTGNVAVGYEAFKTGATFTNSTSIGASTVIGASTSTAIGYGATTSVANSIVLGTATEYVSCPGTSATNGCLKLNGGLKLQSTYSASPSATMLGFQLTNTTGFTIASFTSGSPTNISSAGIYLTAGVWNIDYSIELSIATATATVSAQTLFCSLTTNGVYTTQRISNSGITRIHSTNTYLVADTPCFSGSFNYYVSTATTVFPIFQITFTAGPTISGTGFYRATRVG